MDEWPKRVFLIDDHPIVEAGLRLGFGLSDHFQLVGVARSHKAAVDSIRMTMPDVIISDLVINNEVELCYLTLYREIAPQARLVAFSSLSQDLFGDKCIAAGADGFVSKSTSPHELVAALNTIVSLPVGDLPGVDLPKGNGSAGNPQSTDRVHVFEGVSLTPRETEVSQYLAQGHSIVQIAQRLGISKKTVGIHRDNLRSKLNCATSSELIALLARTLKSGAN